MTEAETACNGPVLYVGTDVISFWLVIKVLQRLAKPCPNVWPWTGQTGLKQTLDNIISLDIFGDFRYVEVASLLHVKVIIRKLIIQGV